MKIAYARSPQFKPGRIELANVRNEMEITARTFNYDGTPGQTGIHIRLTSEEVWQLFAAFGSVAAATINGTTYVTAQIGMPEPKTKKVKGTR